MINPVLNAAMLTSINALQTATLIPSPMTKDALIGAIMAANATVATHSYGGGDESHPDGDANNRGRVHAAGLHPGGLASPVLNLTSTALRGARSRRA